MQELFYLGDYIPFFFNFVNKDNISLHKDLQSDEKRADNLKSNEMEKTKLR